jgi:putative ABC transport system permease protein
MSISFRKVWRDLWNNKARTLLVVLSIAVGVMALGMTTASNSLLQRQMALSRATSHKPHARINLALPVDDDIVAAIAAMPQVAEAEGRIITNISWKPQLEGRWLDAVLTVSPDFAHQVFDIIDLKQGHWPAADEVMIEQNHLAFYGAQFNGILYIQVNERAVPLKVVGTVRDPQQLPPDFSPLNQAALYLSRETAEHILGTRDYNQLRFTVPQYTETNVQLAVEAVQDKLERLGAVSALSTFSADLFDPTGNQNQTVIDGLSLILTVMAAFSLALSVTLVINTINAIVSQQMTQIGIMKTIGGLYGQIVTMYLAGVIVYGLLSLAIAVPLGAIAGYQLSSFWLTAFNVPVAPFEIMPQIFFYQATVAVLTPLLAALWPVLQGVRVPVRQAIAAYGLGTGQYGAGWLDKLIGRIQGIPRMATLSLRNTFRRAGRAALTMVTLIGAGTIFMIVVTAGESFNKTIDSVWSSWGFDVLFVFTGFERIEEMESVISAQPGVNQVEMWVWVTAQAHKPGVTDPANRYDIQMRGIPYDTQMFNPSLSAGRLLDPNDDHAMVLNQKLAAEMNVTVGDTLVVDYGAGKERTWKVVGLVSDIGVGGQQDTAFMWRPFLSEDINQLGRATVAQIGTTNDTRVAQDALKERLQTYFEANNVRITLSTGQLENKELASGLWDIIGGLLQIMTVLVAIVGSIGLSGTLSINVMERRREIGVMRAVGASSGDVAAVFMGEGLLLGVLSWLLALPISIFGARFFVQALGEALAFPFDYRYSYMGMWLWLGIILVLSVVASWLPARRATQISVRESLAYE